MEIILCRKKEKEQVSEREWKKLFLINWTQMVES